MNNGYLVRDLDPLAVTYNDVSVLENFHAAEGFKMMLDPAFDILKVFVHAKHVRGEALPLVIEIGRPARRQNHRLHARRSSKT